MRKFFTRNWMYRLLALIFAVLLFAYVKTDKGASTRVSGIASHQDTSILMSERTATMTMPVDLDINNSDYIVSGYPAEVKVKLTGPSALVTTTVNTQNFKVYLPLQGLSTGDHRVAFKAQGLNKDISYQITPDKTDVTIAHRKTETFAIQPRFDKSMVAKGYVIGTPKLGSTTVKVTGSVADVSKISQVVADISVPKGTKADLNSQVLLQALDANGNIVNVILSPQTVNVTLPISKEKKADQKNDDKADISNASSDKQNSTDNQSKVNGE
ncbi:CdaR family protein [Pediococcus argentinicus]|uniref:CdaR family protein n=1 Tax=Pediococcus argentinicus TaxID=480391 RepID=UPI00338FFDCD